ncbi:MAG TPA: GspE/PulE family protein [Candidatus Saccharimonadales bacterium]|nr:GspE/PulE family protein [Candidatus Saccharimonadales bacterium]
MNHTIQYLQSEAAEQSIETGVLVNCLIMDSIQAGASDIHIEPWESTLVVRIRLNGVLTELVHLPLELMEKISGRFKVMANLISYQTGLPQEGHASTGPDMGGVELRISVFPTTRGEKIVIRLFDPSNRSFDMATLGFDDETLKALTHLLAKPSGLILLTGPTGSGKTTAIYSALYHLVQRNGPAVSISTVEDPVEFNLPMISQAQINPAQDFTYPKALRSLMRQDPQVIMVGEIRDPETASIAVQAGLTGHLVISTIHSGIAAGVYARLINMDIEPFLLASAIIAVLGIRLVRKNCTFCTQTYQPEPGLLRYVPQDLLGTFEFKKGTGCPECMHTGFKGRSAVVELLVADEVFRDAVLQKLPTRALQEVAIKQGMRRMWDSGMKRVVAGQTTLEEILRVIAVDQM